MSRVRAAGPRGGPCYAAAVIEALPILTTQYPALLPEGVALIDAAQPHNAALARRARKAEEPLTVAVFVRASGRGGRPGAEDLVRVGCAAVVEEVVVEHGQLLGVRLRGLARVELIEIEADGVGLRGQVRVLDAPTAADPLLRAQLARVKARLAGSGLPLEAPVRDALRDVEDPGHFADVVVASLTEVAMEQRLALLMAVLPGARLELLDRLIAGLAQAPTTELGRVWAALREPAGAVPGHAALRARARDIDLDVLHDMRLRHVIEELRRAQPILVVELDDSREVEARRESLSQLTAALPALQSLYACGGPEDIAVQREISATIGFLHAAAASERAAIEAALRPISGVSA